MLAENVRRLRVERGWSQQMLAEAVGVTQGAISQIENGSTGPRMATLERLAVALNVEPASLLIPHQELRYESHIRIRDSYNDSLMKQNQVPVESNNIS